jgi:hypothetical protein
MTETDPVSEMDLENFTMMDIVQKHNNNNI